MQFQALEDNEPRRCARYKWGCSCTGRIRRWWCGPTSQPHPKCSRKRWCWSWCWRQWWRGMVSSHIVLSNACSQVMIQSGPQLRHYQERHAMKLQKAFTIYCLVPPESVTSWHVCEWMIENSCTLLLCFSHVPTWMVVAVLTGNCWLRGYRMKILWQRRMMLALPQMTQREKRPMQVMMLEVIQRFVSTLIFLSRALVWRE